MLLVRVAAPKLAVETSAAKAAVEKVAAEMVVKKAAADAMAPDTTAVVETSPVVGVPGCTIKVDGAQVPEVIADAHRSLSIEKGGSLAEAFSNAMRDYADRPCLGWRPGAGQSFEWVSYGTFERESRAVGAALVSLLPPGAMVGIIGANCYGWFLVDFACVWAGMASVPMNEKWACGTLEHVMRHTRLTAVAFANAQHEQVLDAMPPGSCVRFLLSFGNLPASAPAASGVEHRSIPALLARAPLPGATYYYYLWWYYYY